MANAEAEVGLRAKRDVSRLFEMVASDQLPQLRACGNTIAREKMEAAADAVPVVRSLPFLVFKRPSPWARSRKKCAFDCICVLSMLPLLIPFFLMVALAVRLTSFGPVFFRQKRMGRYNRSFTILKFRTIVHSAGVAHPAVTTSRNQQFTPMGAFLRKWKLDEWPQLLNVLLGDMSLVGPRPKLPEHMIAYLACRPGITGAATIAFADEERVLALVPKRHLDNYYQTVVLPAKRQLDSDYMDGSTFQSDLKLIVNSILRRWESSAMENSLKTKALEGEGRMGYWETM